MAKPKPVQPPDPTVVSNAQSAADIATATAQQKLNMINTAGPTGTVNYAADPNAPGGYTQTTTLSQPEQQTYDLSKAAQNGALGIAGDQLGRVSTALSTPLDTSGLPALTGNVQGGPIQGQIASAGQIQDHAAPAGQIQSSFNTGAPLQYSFNPGQQVQGHVGPADLSGAMQQAQNAAYAQATSRLDPQFATAENQQRTRLANEGLSENSAAFQNAMDTFARGKNDAYSQAQQAAVGQGNTAAQQLFDQSVQQGQFANSAAGQQYAQNQGSAAFRNATAGQDFTQNESAAGFGNAAQAQQHGQNQADMAAANAAQAQRYGQNATDLQAANAAQSQQFQQGTSNAQLSDTSRNQGLQERAYVQNQPINQLTGLLGLGQVSTPGGVTYTPSQVAPTDVTGAYALQQQALQANANRAAQSSSGLMGGLFSLGSAAILGSDVRLKESIRLLRRRRDGVGVYSFRYRSGGPVQVGVMAQELRKVRPDLVMRRPDGFLAVNYAGLGAL